MKLSEKQIIFSKNIASLIVYADMIGIDLTFGDAFRSESQILLNFFGYKVVKGGLFGVKLVKHRKLSKTLKSLHAKRLAVDFNFFVNGELTYDKEKLLELGEFWEGLHPDNKWGGFWKFLDTPHFQMNN
ncbi:endolysin [Polaribacter phage P12002L]|uniref:Peptidase M15C domain-containing protein n=1 Tax=Polaribacter phage P12002L TaxID=1647386 RepID=A0A0F7DD09_9CAUD|nr:endolysin [Polaribacter phage P12002L]AKG94206.1 hypothetical protein P12002L_0032 [Polaribacter phage P12002L]